MYLLLRKSVLLNALGCRYVCCFVQEHHPLIVCAGCIVLHLLLLCGCANKRIFLIITRRADMKQFAAVLYFVLDKSYRLLQVF